MFCLQIDCLKSKRILLDLADKLTSNKLSKTVVERRVNTSEKISEIDIQRRIKNESGWPGFQEVFMVSAIEGFGMGDIMVSNSYSEWTCMCYNYWNVLLARGMYNPNYEVSTYFIYYFQV